MLLAGDRVSDRLDHVLNDSRDPDDRRARGAIDAELDRHEQRRQTVRADAREDLEEGAPVLAALERFDRAALLSGGPRVDDQLPAAVALVDRPRPRVEAGKANALQPRRCTLCLA